MMYHFFIIGTYSPGVPSSYSDMLSCMLNSTFESSLDFGTGGGGAFVFANLHKFCSKLAEYHWLAQPVEYLHMAINTKDHVSFLQKY